MKGFIFDLRKVPVARVVLPFAAGLLISVGLEHDKAETWLLFGILFLLLVVLSAHLLARRKSGKFNILFSTGTFLLILLNGTIFGIMADAGFPDYQLGDRGFVVGKIMDGPVGKEHSVAVQVEALYFSDDSTSFSMKENMQVWIMRDTIMPEMIPGKTWIFAGEIKEIVNRGNPGEFDYKGYMLRQNFRYNLFVSSFDHALPIEGLPPDPLYLPQRIRLKIISNWDPDHAGTAILSAITLGYKSFLDKETKTAFSNAGAMHLLAVSGLHVGMVWMMLDLLLRFPKNSRFARTLKLLMILLILWFYAAITGFSVSVNRSVTMFSLVAFSRTLNRQSNIFNTLLLSAMILLVLDPDRIREPGFQLSYMAVFGIVTIQPGLAALYHSWRKPVKKVMDLIAVSIAAQVSTLPLVLLYFHQFPVWFILTNITAIPIVSLLLGAFVLFSPFLIFFPEYAFFSSLLLQVAGMLDLLIRSISSLPYAVIRDVPLHPLVALGLMASIISFVGLLIYKRVAYLLILGIFIAVTTGISAVVARSMHGQTFLDICNFNNASVITYYSGSARTTYVLQEEYAKDPYVADFISSLNRMPGKVFHHTVSELGMDENASNDHYFVVADGLWGISAGGIDILLAGECSETNFSAVVCANKWEVIVFRSGFPWLSSIPALPTGIVLVGDGTLKKYEVRSLEKCFSDVHILREEGALKLTAALLRKNDYENLPISAP
ncbi:MAG: ComEC family competence protein [Bacteroidales bacterium]|nr:ComEC family competence protein [Bacteroidales bacterium]